MSELMLIMNQMKINFGIYLIQLDLEPEAMLWVFLDKEMMQEMKMEFLMVLDQF